MSNKIINEYKEAKEDILRRSNNLLGVLSSKKVTEKSKIKNKSAKVGSGGSNEDLQYFIDNSYNIEEENILHERDKSLKNLKENTIQKNKKENSARSNQQMRVAKNILLAFSKGF